MVDAGRAFYRGKSVFLTGHTGFKGAWLSLWLADMGACVHGYSLPPPTTPSLFEDAGVRSCLASHTVGDVRDAGRLGAALAESGAEIVFHLAAQSLVRRSHREPRETYEINVMGTVNLLEAVRRAPAVRVCQVITTDKCYENREWVYPYRECDPMGGADPYSSSKGCAELVVSAYRQSFFPVAGMDRHNVSLASARSGNVLGGGDWAEDRLVPDCIRSLQKHEPILVRNPQAIRPWQHVLEPLSGYLALARLQWEEPARFADAYNFGPPASGCLTVSEIVELAIRAWGGGDWHPQGGDGCAAACAQRFHEATFLKLDATKACALLNWVPRWSVQEAIERTMAWYRYRQDHGPGTGLKELTLDQIHGYEGCGQGAAPVFR